MNNPTIQQTKDAYRDAASLMLNLFRNDLDSIQSIVAANSSDMNNLLSGMIAISSMIVQKSFEDEAIPALEALVSYLSTIPDDEWQVISTGARLV